MMLSFRDPGEVCLCVAPSCFKISRDQIIRTSASANIDPGCGGTWPGHLCRVILIGDHQRANRVYGCWRTSNA
jgi:hypothetical protein